MWPFFLKFSISASRVLNVPAEEALKAIQDPVFLITLNPLVVGWSADPAKPNHYTIHDRLLLLGFFKTVISYTCDFSTRDDGVDSETQAGLGTRLWSKWRARPISDEPGKTEVSEETTVEVSSSCLLVCFGILPYPVSPKAFFLNMPMIMRTLKASHGELMDSMKAKLEEGHYTPSRYSQPRLHHSDPF